MQKKNRNEKKAENAKKGQKCKKGRKCRFDFKNQAKKGQNAFSISKFIEKSKNAKKANKNFKWQKKAKMQKKVCKKGRGGVMVFYRYAKRENWRLEKDGQNADGSKAKAFSGKR